MVGRISVSAVPTGNTVLARTMARFLGSLLVAQLLVLGPGPTVAPVLASCAAPPTLRESLALADVVVVGTVTHLENDGRWATVRVEERWRGPQSMGDTIDIRGGPAAGAGTSVDRVFTEDRYLFFLTTGPEYFVDNACTATQVWSEELAWYRPAGVMPAPVVEAGAPLDSLGIDVVPVAALAGVLLIAVVSYLFILRGRRRPPDWMR